jgi:hypothetical protein
VHALCRAAEARAALEAARRPPVATLASGAARG